MQHEKSCGAIVYRKSHGNTEILLIKHINSGHWSFPKGHMENGETEIEEEEIAEIRWVDIGYASTILTYENDKNIVNKAKAAIKEF